MANQCFASIQLCAIRTARLTEAGAPDTGATNGYVSDAMVKLQVGVELEEGADVTQKNGCGSLVAAIKEPDLIKRVSLQLDLSRLDAELKWVLLGGDVITSGGNTVGYQSATSSDEPPAVCFEAWSKAWDGTQQAVSSLSTPNSSYVHWVFPFTRWAQGQFTMERENFLVDPLTADGTENTEITVNGPFDDWPAAITSLGGITSFYGWWFDDDLPTAACGRISVSSAAS